jgi:hypothetical protein
LRIPSPQFLDAAVDQRTSNPCHALPDWEHRSVAWMQQRSTIGETWRAPKIAHRRPAVEPAVLIEIRVVSHLRNFALAQLAHRTDPHADCAFADRPHAPGLLDRAPVQYPGFPPGSWSATATRHFDFLPIILISLKLNQVARMNSPVGGHTARGRHLNHPLVGES